VQRTPKATFRDKKSLLISPLAGIEPNGLSEREKNGEGA